MKIRVKNPVVDDWTTVPGWNGAKQEYRDLDCERWIGENGIREAGHENGKQEFPRSDADQPDEMYMKILDWVNKRGRACHADVSTYLVQQRHALEMETREGMAPIRHKVEGLRDQGIVELTDQGEKDRSALTQKEREARNAWASLAAFRAKANLERVAEYNERDTWYWWLVGIIVIEAVANAMMLGDVHEYGRLGAMAVMLGVGAVNAGILGCVIGEGWRQTNSVGLLQKLGGWIVAALGVTGMIVWNLLVGHFRDSMLAVVTKATLGASSLGELLTDDTVERFLKDPLGLEGMQSWVLAAIGAGCCALAATKWLKRDDVYPGYGTVHRAATEHNEEYMQEITQRREDLNLVYTGYVGNIRDERDQVQNKKGNHVLITGKARNIVRQFPMQLRQYQNNLDFILSAYRSENEKARKTPSPKFFSQKFTIDQDMLEPPAWEGVPESDYDDDWDSFQEAENAVRKAYLDALAGYPTLEDLMEGESARARLRQ